MEMGVGEAFPKGENFSLPTDRTQSNKRNNAPRSRANVAGFFLLRLNDFFSPAICSVCLRTWPDLKRMLEGEIPTPATLSQRGGHFSNSVAHTHMHT